MNPTEKRRARRKAVRLAVRSMMTSPLYNDILPRQRRRKQLASKFQELFLSMPKTPKERITNQLQTNLLDLEE